MLIQVYRMQIPNSLMKCHTSYYHGSIRLSTLGMKVQNFRTFHFGFSHVHFGYSHVYRSCCVLHKIFYRGVSTDANISFKGYKNKPVNVYFVSVDFGHYHVYWSCRVLHKIFLSNNTSSYDRSRKQNETPTRAGGLILIWSLSLLGTKD